MSNKHFSKILKKLAAGILGATCSFGGIKAKAGTISTEKTSNETTNKTETNDELTQNQHTKYGLLWGVLSMYGISAMIWAISEINDKIESCSRLSRLIDNALNNKTGKICDTLSCVTKKNKYKKQALIYGLVTALLGSLSIWSIFKASKHFVAAAEQDKRKKKDNTDKEKNKNNREKDRKEKSNQ